MRTVILTFSSALLLAAAALLPGCEGDCTRASDCAADEVCYQEICQKAFSQFYDMTCTKDSDCDGNGDGNSALYCELGKCRIRQMQGPMVPDGGAADAMPTDGPVDGGPTDSGPTDTGTVADAG